MANICFRKSMLKGRSTKNIFRFHTSVLSYTPLSVKQTAKRGAILLRPAQPFPFTSPGQKFHGPKGPRSPPPHVRPPYRANEKHGCQREHGESKGSHVPVDKGRAYSTDSCRDSFHLRPAQYPHVLTTPQKSAILPKSYRSGPQYGPPAFPQFLRKKQRGREKKAQ
jgi:hypothetical protein